MNAFNSCDGTDIFIRWEMKCSIQLGFASNRTFHLSPHENICTIALITIHYLYNNLALWSSWSKCVVMYALGTKNYIRITLLKQKDK